MAPLNVLFCDGDLKNGVGEVQDDFKMPIVYWQLVVGLEGKTRKQFNINTALIKENNIEGTY